jgi:hypothetical protein
MRVARAVQRPSVDNPMSVPALGWEATIRRVLVEALAEAEGLEIVPPELPSFEETPRSGLHDLLAAFLQDAYQSAGDASGRSTLRSALGAAEAVRMAEGLGAALDEGDLADIRKFIGGRPRNLTQGRAKLLALVADEPGRNTDRLVPLFYRMEVRRETLRRPLMLGQRGAGHLQPLADRG